jgi:hypothetical protein
MDNHQQALEEAVAAVFGNELRRRLVMLLLDNPDGMRYTKARQATGTTSNNEFQRAVDDLTRHVVIDRRLEPTKGDRWASVLQLSARGQRIARGMRELITIKHSDEVIGAAIADQVSGHYKGAVLAH